MDDITKCRFAPFRYIGPRVKPAAMHLWLSATSHISRFSKSLRQVQALGLMDFGNPRPVKRNGADSKYERRILMLYKLEKDNTIEPLSFVDFSDQNKLEKDLENLLAENLFSKLFENTPLLTIFQERPRQGEADIYALNKFGDLVVFELKRSKAGSGSIDQLFRYVTEAGEWTYTE